MHKEKCATSVPPTKRRRAGPASQTCGKWWKIEAAKKKEKKETQAGMCAGILWSEGLHVLVRSLWRGNGPSRRKSRNGSRTGFIASAGLISEGPGSWTRSRGRRRTVSTMKWQPEVKTNSSTWGCLAVCVSLAVAMCSCGKAHRFIRVGCPYCLNMAVLK